MSKASVNQLIDAGIDALKRGEPGSAVGAARALALKVVDVSGGDPAVKALAENLVTTAEAVGGKVTMAAPRIRSTASRVVSGIGSTARGLGSAAVGLGSAAVMGTAAAVKDIGIGAGALAAGVGHGVGSTVGGIGAGTGSVISGVGSATASIAPVVGQGLVSGTKGVVSGAKGVGSGLAYGARGVASGLAYGAKGVGSGLAYGAKGIGSGVASAASRLTRKKNTTATTNTYNPTEYEGDESMFGTSLTATPVRYSGSKNVQTTPPKPGMMSRAGNAFKSMRNSLRRTVKKPATVQKSERTAMPNLFGSSASGSTDVAPPKRSWVGRAGNIVRGRTPENARVKAMLKESGYKRGGPGRPNVTSETVGRGANLSRYGAGV